MSIALSDAQVDQILRICRPLRPEERTTFIAALFEDLLMRRDEVGDGELGRTLRDQQHRYFQPPSGAAIRLENQKPATTLANKPPARGLFGQLQHVEPFLGGLKRVLQRRQLC